MSLPNGTRLGSYEIISQLGAGGMGEVYRAHDSRLERDVAIKVLPAALATDRVRLLRFEQEARTTSAINHPNILAVYDFGMTDSGAPFLVAELLEGEELRQHLNHGPIAPRKVIDYARQLAGGLAAAHAKGVIHRDLKPENLFITNDDRVKILDFGLAKFQPQMLTAEPDFERATQIDLTNPGVVMGTVRYMSPEQVRGQSLDHRSDIFSFGVVLHEMLSGQRTFKGDSPLEVINAILKEEPQELSESNTRINPALEKIVHRCLEKNRDRRFQSTTDLCFAIETLSTPSYAPIDLTATVSTTARRWLFNKVWLVVAIAFIGLLGGVSLVNSGFRREPDKRTVQSFITEPENFGNSSGVFSISPDDHYLAFAGVLPGKQSLWVRALDALSWRQLAGTEGAIFPFWSPDSRSIGFFADGKLKKIDLAGGPPLTLCDAPAGMGGTWNREGIIVFSPNTEGPLYRISASGGAVNPITKPGKEGWNRWPSFLPDGRHFLFAGSDGIYLGSLDSPQSRLLLQADSNALYAQGHLLFLRAQTLMAQPFDATRLELRDNAYPIAEPISIWGFRGAFSASEQGILLHRMGQARGTYAQLTWVDRNGKQMSVFGEPGLYPNLHFSPDGKKLALTTGGAKRNVGIYDLQRQVATRLTLDPADVTEAVWSPDGSRIAFNSRRKGSLDLYQRSSHGSGSEELLANSELEKYPTSWSPDGRYLLYDAFNPSSAKSDMWVLPLASDRKPFPYLQTAFNEARGQFSPDGRWILYTSDESGKEEVYLGLFPGPGEKLRLSPDGGTYPRWRHDGKEIFYFAPDNKLRAIEIKLDGSTAKIGEPRVLFEFRSASLYRNGYPYDVTADGQRFLVNMATERKEQTFITLVQNWTRQLKK